jgi:hypothetical protein
MGDVSAYLAQFCDLYKHNVSLTEEEARALLTPGELAELEAHLPKNRRTVKKLAR